LSKIVGLDVGYGFVKVTDGELGYSFPSVVGEGHTRQTFNLRKEQVPIIDDLKIGLGQNLYFVGKAAIRHSKFVYRDLSYTRSVGSDFEVLFYSALSLFNTNNPEEDFKVVTGLPVERMHLAKELEERIKGEKTIKVFNQGNNQDTRVINVSKIDIVPQPLGTYWAHFIKSDGTGEISLPEGLTGIIDIGFRTTDLAAIENGEYIPEKSKSINVGLATAYKEISSSLSENYGFEKEDYALDNAVINRKINISGQKFDITPIVEKAFEKLAMNIIVEINSLWRSYDFEKFILTGGGGQAVSTNILSQLPQAMLASAPIISNCTGYLSWGKYLWQA